MIFYVTMHSVVTFTDQSRMIFFKFRLLSETSGAYSAGEVDQMN